jgi:transcriptional regulator with XRE-family HTH domain
MATNLRQLRLARDMTQEEMAAAAGLSARYIGSIERADASASVTVLDQIATVLAVEAAELVRSAAPQASKEDDHMSTRVGSGC